MRMTKATLGLLLSGVLLTSCGERNLTGPEAVSTSSGAYSLLPPGMYLDSARLVLFVCQTQVQTVVVHPQQSAWDEMSATWNSIGSALSPFVLATFRPKDSGWFRIDVTGLVRLWLDGTWANHGILLDQNAPEYLRTQFCSRETRTRKPQLNLYFSIADSNAIYGFSASADAVLDAAAPGSNFGSDSVLSTGWTSLEPGERRTLIAFDFNAPQEEPISRLGDRVWLDANRDGLQDPDEQGFAGVTVRLWDCAGQSVLETVTDSSGHYRFDSLAAGSYRLQFVCPEGHAFTAQDQGAADSLDSDADSAAGFGVCLDLGEGMDDYSWDAGLYVPTPEPSSGLGDRAWLDANINGVQDEGEPGVSDVGVLLLDCDGSILADTRTDATGHYRFGALPPGIYKLKFIAPAGRAFSPSDRSAADELDSDADPATGQTVCFELSSGASDLSRDAGLFEPEPLTSGCTRTRNFWKHHAGQDGEPDWVSQHLPIRLGLEGGAQTIVIEDAATAYRYLGGDNMGGGDQGIATLYAELLAAKLNLAEGAPDDEIAETLLSSDTFLAEASWQQNPESYEATGCRISHWRNILNSWNRGKIGPGVCTD